MLLISFAILLDAPIANTFLRVELLHCEICQYVRLLTTNCAVPMMNKRELLNIIDDQATLV